MTENKRQAVECLAEKFVNFFCDAMSVVQFLTHILIGESSVRGHIDEEDSLACVATEVYSATPVQSLCLVFVNGVIRG